MPSVSIIICTRDRAEPLRRTLGWLGAVRIPEGLSAEVLVIDGSAGDATADAVREWAARGGPAGMPVRHVRQPRPGLSRSRNVAVAEARGDILLFTDDDVRPPEDWIAGMTGPILRGEADAVAGGVRFAPHLERAWMGQPQRDYLACTGGLDADAPDRMVGASMAFSRTVLDTVPRFDEALGAGALGLGEETLFASQMRQAGLRIVGALDVAVEHHFDESRLLRASFLASARAYGRSSAYAQYHWEHFGASVPRLRLWASWAKLAAARLRRGRPAAEGIPTWEMRLVERVAFYQQYLIERRRPRRYARFGPARPGGGSEETTL